ncbi:MAG: LptF/LptG family permease [Phycisphaerales bacterium]|nr:LptF/LptG family permease [Phycisphaerales bacterium]
MRLPWTLWLSMSIELWRLVLLTTAVLVTVIAFALSIKPLASGDLGPVDAVRFMLWAMPPMLTYALPFASCFGATLAYHRMVQDRELLAAHAGGVSHLTLIAPALAAGVVLAAVLGGLNAQIIPRFVRTMQEMVADDLARVIVNQVEAGQAVERREIILSAQTARLLNPEEMEGATARLWLTGVVAMPLDDQRRPSQEVFADSAQVWILPGSRDPELGEIPGQVLIQVSSGQGFTSDGTEMAVASQTRAFPLPNAFRDDPAFLTSGELDALRGEPEQMNFIDWRRIDLAYHLASREVLRTLAEQLRAGGSVRLEREGETVVIKAAGLREREGSRFFLRPDEAAMGVVIDVRRVGEDGLARLDTYKARRAFVEVNLGANWRARELSLDLTLIDFAPMGLGTTAPDGRPVATQSESRWTGLRIASSPERDYLALGSHELLERSDEWQSRTPADPELAGVTGALRWRLAQLDREVLGTRHLRLAMAAACLVMVVGGSIASMRLQGAQALVIYCWAFFPAIAAIVTVSAGKEMVHRGGVEWLVLLWGGVAAIGVGGMIGLLSVSRN